MAKKGKRVGPGGSTASSMAAERRHILTPNSNFFVREAYKTLRTNTMLPLPSTRAARSCW